MGTLAALAPILGLLSGCIIAKLVPYELKHGRKYFTILAYALGLATIGLGVWQKVNGQPIQLIIPLFLLFIPIGTLYHKNYKLLSGLAAIYAITAVLMNF